MNTQKNQELGFDELVDTAADILNMAKKIGEAASDGLDLGDVGVIFEIAPDFVEVARDGNQAVQELLDLTPEEAKLAAEAIAEKANLPADGILGKVRSALTLVARTYQEVMDDLDLIGDWKEWVNSLKPVENAG